MQDGSATYKISFDETVNLFEKLNETEFVLKPSLGIGSVRVYYVEKGVQARIWDCSFIDGVEIYKNPISPNSYYTLAFFLDMEGLNLGVGDSIIHKKLTWDIIFSSPGLNFRLYLSAGYRVQCLSFSFSEQWLNQNIIKGEESFGKLIKEISTEESFLLFDCMSAQEKNAVGELVGDSSKTSLGSFHMKSAVLKILSDFFSRIIEKKGFISFSPEINDPIIRAEKIISSQVTGPLPNLKELANKFSMSESTFKRRFKKKYGDNISTYFIKKKMEYARELIEEKNFNINQAAETVGYQSKHNFLLMYNRHCKRNEQ